MDFQAPLPGPTWRSLLQHMVDVYGRKASNAMARGGMPTALNTVEPALDPYMDLRRGGIGLGTGLPMPVAKPRQPRGGPGDLVASR